MFSNNKLNYYLKKYHLQLSDVVASIGAIIVLLGVYFFNFIDVNIPLFGNTTLSLANCAKLIKEMASSSDDMSNSINQFSIFIFLMTVLPAIIVVCSFINQKKAKIINSISALIATILYLIFHFKIQSFIRLEEVEFSSLNFGAAGNVIILGLIVMLIGSMARTAQEFKNSNVDFSFDFSKITKRQWKIVGGVAAIVIVLSSVFLIINNMPKSIIEDVEVSFSGYDHQGTATLKGKYEDKIERIVSKKEGIVPSDISVELDKDKGLSNGDKVKISVTSDVEKSPVKTQTKTITVSGLKKSTTYTVGDILKKNPVEFIGFNHYGFANLEDSNLYTTEDKVTGLSNGDSIKVTLDSEYIDKVASEGKILEGADSQKITVSGLKDTPQIANLENLLSQIDIVARDDNKSNSYSKYTVTREEAYFIGTNINTSWISNENDTAGEFSVVVVYKVDTIRENTNDSTRYKIYGYSGLTLQNNQVNVSSLNSGDKYSDYLSFESKQEALDSLKADYPSITQLQ